jgi:hypothetical protein
MKHEDPNFGRRAISDLVSCMWNYWNPIAETVLDNIDYRITEGFIDWVAKKKSYLLYKDGCIVGVFKKVDDAKVFVAENHKKFCNIKDNLYLYNLNPYNQN